MVNEITDFKIEQSGQAELKTFKDGRYITYKYYDVPKKVILKFFSCKKAPTISDFDQWVKDCEKKKEVGPDYNNSWWDGD